MRGRLTLGMLTCLVALSVAGPSAMAVRAHVFGSAFGSACTTTPCGDGEFNEPSGAAVNEASHDVYVVDKGDGRVERFGESGEYESQFDASGLLPGEGTGAPTGKLASPEGIAIDNACVLHAPVLSGAACTEFDPSAGDVYVVDAGHAVVDKFTATGEYLGQITEAEGVAFSEVNGVAVDASGRLAIYQAEKTIDEFGNELANLFISSFKSEAEGLAVPGIAVDRSGAFYVVHRFAKVLAKIDSEGHLLTEDLDGEEVAGVAVEPSSNDVFVAKAAGVDVFTAGGAVVEHFGASQLQGASAIGIDGTSDQVYVADRVTNLVDVYVPQPPGPPSIEEVSVGSVSATAATVHAQINPGGEATTYLVEYGLCPTQAQCVSAPFDLTGPTSEGTLPASFTATSIEPRLEGLQAGRAYHFRLVVTNADETVKSGEGVFTTQASGGPFSLPDGREWELVSPMEKHGALIEAIGQGLVAQTTEDGSAMTYAAAAPTSDEPEGNSNLAQVVSTRTPAGWRSQEVTPPHATDTGVSQQGEEYRFFSADLASAIVQPYGAVVPSGPTGLTAEEAAQQEPTAFLRAISGDGPEGWCAAGCYRPLATALPGIANVPAGTKFGQQCGGIFCGPAFAGATPDLRAVILESQVALTATPIGERALYEWSDGQMQLASVLPDGSAPPSRAALGLGGEVTRHAISDDGSRVIWSEDKSKHLYLRDVRRGETVQLDEVQGGSGENSSEPAFQFASSDGSKIFFTDHQRLTSDSGGGESVSHQEDDLYECRIVVSEEHLSCALSDLTPQVEGASANVLNQVLGGSEDGSYVYFVANGELAQGAVSGSCAAGLASSAGVQCNLYVAHFSGGGWATKLVAVLSMEDFPDWNGEANIFYTTKTPVRVSPDGRQLVFMSARGLTGYDSHDAVTGRPDEEVYLYSADSGKVSCASCNPSGARPAGIQYKDLHYGLDGIGVWPEGRLVSGSVPAWDSYGASGQASYDSRFVSNSGRVFFNSVDGLVPSDVNGVGDVYEFEPAGIGGCTVGGAGFSEVSGGCVALISSGGGAEESGFLDASASGDDVFFFTGARLSPSDSDTALDVYDAHVCSTAAPCLGAGPETPPACSSADGCRAAPSSQPNLFGAPASATFTGAGNVTPSPAPKPPLLTRAQRLHKALAACRKRYKRRASRAVCESAARRRFGPNKKPHAKHRAGKAGA